MTLTPEQLGEVRDLLVQKFDDAGKDLDQVVKFNLGTGLFVDYAPRGAPFRTVVSELLAKTERRGSTCKLLAGVLNFLPDDAIVKNVIGRVLPEAVAAAPETATQVE